MIDVRSPPNSLCHYLDRPDIVPRLEVDIRSRWMWEGRKWQQSREIDAGPALRHDRPAERPQGGRCFSFPLYPARLQIYL